MTHVGLMQQHPEKPANMLALLFAHKLEQALLQHIERSLDPKAGLLPDPSQATA